MYDRLVHLRGIGRDFANDLQLHRFLFLVEGLETRIIRPIIKGCRGPIDSMGSMLRGYHFLESQNQQVLVFER